MLPDLLTPKLRPGLDTSIAPTAPVKNISDALADFAPGQKIMAEIQAMLPNGAYRALVGQRELTLALPFSAKPGDTLELEVQENDGRLVLAFVKDKAASEAAVGNRNDSAATTLSNTGRLIGDLLGEVTRDSKRPSPIALNGNQPLIAAGQGEHLDAKQLAGALKQALGQSGMFYEAHQARWVQGALPEEQLRQEPQGKLSAPALPPTPAPATALTRPAGETEGRSSGSANISTSAASLAAPEIRTPRNDESSANTPLPLQESRDGNKMSAAPPTLAPLPGNEVHRDTVPLVQNQLDALATQQFIWQGQAWSGQPMHWEIAEEQGQNRGQDEDEGRRWRTRLRLNLPQLGGIDATLQLLPGGEVRIRMTADSERGEQSLRQASPALQEQYLNAGLTLGQLQIDHDLPQTLGTP